MCACCVGINRHHVLGGFDIGLEIDVDASSKNASVAIILAPNELELGEIIIKSLRTGKERKLHLEKLVEELRFEISNVLDK